MNTRVLIVASVVGGAAAAGFYACACQVLGVHMDGTWSWLGGGAAMLASVVSPVLIRWVLSRAAAYGAFHAARVASVNAPWGSVPAVDGPWPRLDVVPEDASRVTPPARGTTLRVLASDGLGPTVLVEQNDLGLCLVTRVGVEQHVTRWLYLVVAPEEVVWLDDGERTPRDMVLTHPVVIVDMAHDGSRFQAWQSTGHRLPLSYWPAAGKLKPLRAATR